MDETQSLLQYIVYLVLFHQIMFLISLPRMMFYSYGIMLSKINVLLCMQLVRYNIPLYGMQENGIFFLLFSFPLFRGIQLSVSCNIINDSYTYSHTWFIFILHCKLSGKFNYIQHESPSFTLCHSCLLDNFPCLLNKRRHVIR